MFTYLSLFCMVTLDKLLLLHSQKWCWMLSVYIHSFIHSIGICRMWQFLAVLRIFFHFSLLYTLSFHPFPPTSLPSSHASSCYLFLGLPLSFVASKFVYNFFGGILFSSILCTYPNQRNLFNLIVSVIVGFFNHFINFFIWFTFSSFLFHCHILGLKHFYTLSFQMFICFLSLFVSFWCIHYSFVYYCVL